MESLERFRQSRAVIEDFTSRTLAAVRSDFGRLYYLSSLKDPGTGSYEHEGLKQLYSEGSVQSALEHCHRELFARILETPLENQECDLRLCLEPAGEKIRSVLEAWQEKNFTRTLCPEGLPEYLNDLFSSNLRALLRVCSASEGS